MLITPSFQNISAFIRHPKVLPTLPHNLLLEPSSSFINLENLYVDVYKKINVSNTAWSLSIFNTGFSVISGVLTKKDIPVQGCRLYLYQTSTGVLAKATISQEDGSFKFTGILEDVSYYIVAIDNDKLYNAVVIDNIRIDSALS